MWNGRKLSTLKSTNMQILERRFKRKKAVNTCTEKSSQKSKKDHKLDNEEKEDTASLHSSTDKEVKIWNGAKQIVDMEEALVLKENTITESQNQRKLKTIFTLKMIHLQNGLKSRNKFEPTYRRSWRNRNPNPNRRINEING